MCVVLAFHLAQIGVNEPEDLRTDDALKKNSHIFPTGNLMVCRKYTPLEIARQPKGEAVYYMGLDMHKKFTQACVIDTNGRTLCNERIMTDVMAISHFFEGKEGKDK